MASPSTMRASAWVVFLPLRSTRARASTLPPGTGAMNVTCRQRSGASGTSVRNAARPIAACSPPKSVRPCSQSSGTSTRASPAAASMRDIRTEYGVGSLTGGCRAC